MYGSLFDYLRLDKSIGDSIIMTEDKIKIGNGSNKVRKIFKLQQFDAYENRQIVELKQLISVRDKNPQYQTDEVFLRYIYANEMNIESAYKQFHGNLSWFKSNPKVFEITREVQVLLKSGAIYIQGRDKDYRPTLVINSHKLDQQKYPIFLIEKAINILMGIMEDYMFYPGKIETWVVIIETEEQSIFHFPVKEMTQMMATFQMNFPNTLEKLYIIKPSLQLKFSWNGFKGSISKYSQSKVFFLETREELLNYHDPDQLDQNLGGSRPSTNYWPPDAIFHKRYQTPIIQKQKDPQIIYKPIEQKPIEQTILKEMEISVKKSDHLCKNCAPELKKPIKIQVEPQRAERDSFSSYQRKYDSFVPAVEVKHELIFVPQIQQAQSFVFHQQHGDHHNCPECQERQKLINEMSVYQQPIPDPQPQQSNYYPIPQPQIIPQVQYQNHVFNQNEGDHHDCAACQERQRFIDELESGDKRINTQQILQQDPQQGIYKNPYFQDQLTSQASFQQKPNHHSQASFQQQPNHQQSIQREDPYFLKYPVINQDIQQSYFQSQFQQPYYDVSGRYDQYLASEPQQTQKSSIQQIQPTVNVIAQPEYNYKNYEIINSQPNMYKAQSQQNYQNYDAQAQPDYNQKNYQNVAQPQNRIETQALSEYNYKKYDSQVQPEQNFQNYDNQAKPEYNFKNYDSKFSEFRKYTQYTPDQSNVNVREQVYSVYPARTTKEFENEYIQSEALVEEQQYIDLNNRGSYLPKSTISSIPRQTRTTTNDQKIQNEKEGYQACLIF